MDGESRPHTSPENQNFFRDIFADDDASLTNELPLVELFSPGKQRSPAQESQGSMGAPSVAAANYIYGAVVNSNEIQGQPQSTKQSHAILTEILQGNPSSDIRDSEGARVHHAPLQSSFNQPSATTSPGSMSMASSSQVNTASHSSPACAANPGSNISKDSPESNLNSVVSSPSNLENKLSQVVTITSVDQFQSSPAVTLWNTQNQAAQHPPPFTYQKKPRSPTEIILTTAPKNTIPRHFSADAYRDFKQSRWKQIKHECPDLAFAGINKRVTEEWHELKRQHGFTSIKKRRHDETRMDTAHEVGGAMRTRPPSSLGAHSSTKEILSGKPFASKKHYDIGIKSKPSAVKHADIAQGRSVSETSSNYPISPMQVCGPVPLARSIRSLTVSSVHGARDDVSGYSLNVYGGRRSTGMASGLNFSHIEQQSAALSVREECSGWVDSGKPRSSGGRGNALMLGRVKLEGGDAQGSSDLSGGQSEGRTDLKKDCFDLRSLAGQIQTMCDTRQDEIRKINGQIYELENTNAYKAIQAHRISVKHLEDLTYAYQSLRQKYRKYDDEPLVLQGATHHQPHFSYSVAPRSALDHPQHILQGQPHLIRAPISVHTSMNRPQISQPLHAPIHPPRCILAGPYYPGIVPAPVGAMPPVNNQQAQHGRHPHGTGPTHPMPSYHIRGPRPNQPH